MGFLIFSVLVIYLWAIIKLSDGSKYFMSTYWLIVLARNTRDINLDRQGDICLGSIYIEKDHPLIIKVDGCIFDYSGAGVFESWLISKFKGRIIELNIASQIIEGLDEYKTEGIWGE